MQRHVAYNGQRLRTLIRVNKRFWDSFVLLKKKHADFKTNKHAYFCLFVFLFSKEIDSHRRENSIVDNLVDRLLES